MLEQRREFQLTVDGRYRAIVGRATGRRVVAFISGNQEHPDLMAETFVLARE